MIELILNPAWVGGCRGVSLHEPVLVLGFKDLRREFVSQMTFDG